MARRDIGTDDPRVRVRPGKGSRPRSKRRPDYSDATIGWVLGVSRGRYEVLVEDRHVMAVKARELGRHGVIVGDRVRIVGDLSGRKDTLDRIVAVEDRSCVLMRCPEEGDTKGRERPMVANADNLVIVTALADPPPRLGMIDRCLIAAYAAGLTPILVLTKTDLASPTELTERYRGLGIKTLAVHALAADDAGVNTVETALEGQTSVLIGHSGVGKTTLLNALVPGTDRLTGNVNQTTGRGRHTTTAALAFPLHGTQGGWLIDTPGVRSFGLAHVEPENVLSAFPDMAAAASDCPRGCTHEEQQQCALDTWADDSDRKERLGRIRTLLASLRETPDWERN